jgi:superfamily II DNA or RNA helicase
MATKATKISKAQFVAKAQSFFGDNVKVEYRRATGSGWYLCKDNYDCRIGTNINEAWDWLNQTHKFDIQTEVGQIRAGATIQALDPIETDAFPTLFEKPLVTIHQALKYLSARCDGANAQDGCGFNKFDAQYGQYLASLPELTQHQARTGWVLLKKYRKQLQEGGIDYDAIPEPPKPTGAQPDRYIAFNTSGQFLVYSHFDDNSEFQNFLAAIRKVSGRYFDYGTKTNVIPRRVESVEAMVEIAQHWHFEFSGAALNAIAEIMEHPEQAEHARQISLDGNRFRVRFDYDANVIAAMRNVPRRKYQDGYGDSVPLFRNSCIALREVAQQFNFYVSPEARTALDNPPPEVKQIRAGTDFLVVEYSHDRDFTAAMNFPGSRFVEERPDGIAIRHVALSVDSISRMYDIATDFGLKITDQADHMMQEALEQMKANIEASRAENSDLRVEGLGGELRPFQRAGVAYAIRAKRAFIADEMGLGKTVQALATIQATGAYPALIVCPASLKLNWQREAKKWLPGRSVSIFTAAGLAAEIEIINYDILKKNLNLLKMRGFKAVIFDESHALKNRKSQRTEAAAELSKGIEIRLALTGTPVLNRPQELLSQLKILGRLDDVGGFWKFAERYCAAQKTRWGWDFSGSANLTELNEKLRSICYIRRDKAGVLAELPAKQRSVISLDIDNRREYQKVERNLIEWLTEQKGEKLAERAKYAEQLVKIEYLKQLAAQGKLSALFEWIESFLESGEKLVLFATHQNIIDAIAEKFSSALTLTGETPQTQRQELVDKFQTDPETKLIVMNMKAGGVGLTLTAASNVAFLELGWTPADHSQAEDRCHRIGQRSSVNVWYLLANKTIDEEIYQLIDAKRKVVDVATEGGEMEKNRILQELIASLGVNFEK